MNIKILATILCIAYLSAAYAKAEPAVGSVDYIWNKYFLKSSSWNKGAKKYIQEVTLKCKLDNGSSAV